MGNSKGGASVTPARALSDFEEGILANVEQFGCQVNYVFDPDGKEEAFSYSIGFPASVEQPEVIVFGLPQGLMHSMINECLRQCRDEGLCLNDGRQVDGLIDGFSCIIRAIPKSAITAEFFNSALWFASHSGAKTALSACQIVWPGAQDGLLPWDEEATDEFRAMQPALYDRKHH